MKLKHVIFILDGTFQGQLNDSISKDGLKRPISPFLEAGFEKFFDNHLQN